jgi:hypothetical protein
MIGDRQAIHAFFGVIWALLAIAGVGFFVVVQMRNAPRRSNVLADGTIVMLPRRRRHYEGGYFIDLSGGANGHCAGDGGHCDGGGH